MFSESFGVYSDDDPAPGPPIPLRGACPTGVARTASPYLVTSVLERPIVPRGAWRPLIGDKIFFKINVPDRSIGRLTPLAQSRIRTSWLRVSP